MYSSAVFAGGRRLYIQILPRHGRSPSTIISVRKLETRGLPDGKDCILLMRSLVLTQYRRVTDR